jgi:hypothetical protein
MPPDAMTQLREHSARGAVNRWAFLRRPLWIFVVAFLLRAGVAGELLLHNPLSWKANEPSAIASALVQGRGFSSAFHDTNQPTAWLAPVYPALLACIFRLFGIQTSSSAVVAILLNVIFASLTAVVVVQLGREQFGERTGLVAGWAWSLSPPLLLMPWILWETCFSGLVMTFSLLMTLRLGDHARTRHWACCGAIWGFAALLNPVLLVVLPVLALHALMRTGRWKEFALMTAVCILCFLPWIVRNCLVFGKLIPIRSNLWAEVYFGNVDFYPQPVGSSMMYQREGELIFEAELKQRFLNFLRSDPGPFLRKTRERTVSFWMQPLYQRSYPPLLFLASIAGIVMSWKRGKRWLPFAAVMLFYPLIYYITYTFARYRYPIEPIMYVLAAYLGCELYAFTARRLRHPIHKSG